MSYRNAEIMVCNAQYEGKINDGWGLKNLVVLFVCQLHQKGWHHGSTTIIFICVRYSGASFVMVKWFQLCVVYQLDVKQIQNAA